MLISRKIVRVYCPLCGWAKVYDPADLNVDIPDICPACGDNQQKAWSLVDEAVDEILKADRGKKKNEL